MSALRFAEKEERRVALPRWERGYRVHGLWFKDPNQRVGRVGLTPPGHPVVYSWGLDAVPEAYGECRTLAAAKRRVWSAFKKNYSWIFDGARHGLWKLT
jgi:hypothetical protein